MNHNLLIGQDGDYVQEQKRGRADVSIVYEMILGIRVSNFVGY